MITEQISPQLLALAKQSDAQLKETYDRIDAVALHNSDRILSAFIENRVSYSDFAEMNGYGNYDEGRDKECSQPYWGVRMLLSDLIS